METKISSGLLYVSLVCTGVTIVYIALGNSYLQSVLMATIATDVDPFTVASNSPIGRQMLGNAIVRDF